MGTEALGFSTIFFTKLSRDRLILLNEALGLI